MAFLKKNKFWIASFALVAAMIGTWFYSTGALTAKTEDRVTKIKASLQQVKAVQQVTAEEGVSAHPNQTTEEGMKVKLETLSDSVLQAWKARYDAQRQVMKWPDEILVGNQGRAFIREFSKFDPPETLPKDEKGDSETMRRLLRVYKQQIPSQMEHICSIIKSDWRYQEELDRAFVQKDDEEPKDGDSDAKDDEQREKDRKEAFESGRQIVMWSENNQALWYQKLTSFRGRDDNEFVVSLPSPSQVYMLQQDLWLLEAMFDIVRVVNARKDADGNMMMGNDGKPLMVLANDLAPVKKIDHVVFGREALSLLGDIQDTLTSDTSGTGAGGIPARGGRGGGRGGPSSSNASDVSFAYLGQPAFHGRYVNSNLEPIEADKIRSVLTGTTLPADNLEMVVAKRVPVRIAVQMDERKIADFLAACANSPFAFEVWQVRVNKHDPEEVIKLRGSEGAAVGGIGGRGGGRGVPGGQRGAPDIGAAGGSAGLAGLSGSGGSSTSKSDVEVAVRKDYDVGVEFYGIIKIYNPVNEALLGKEKVSETANP